MASSSRAAVSVSPVASATRTICNRPSIAILASTDPARSGSTTFWIGHSVSPGIAPCEPSPTPLIVATMMAAAAASGARWRNRSARLRRVPAASAFIPATTAATAVSRSTSSGIGSDSISARHAASIATRRSSRGRRRSGADPGARSP